MRAVWDTNVFGVLAVYQAMLPLLRETPGARIVNVSSGVGSLTTNSDPAFAYRAIFGPVYPASKTALNALTLAMAIELEPEGIKVNAVSPGFTKTNLNGYSGTETVEEGAREAVRVALLGPDAPTGAFTRLGRPKPSRGDRDGAADQRIRAASTARRHRETSNAIPHARPRPASRSAPIAWAR